MVDSFDTYDEALKAIDEYMKKDWAEGNRRIDLYNVVDEDQNVIHKYLVRIHQAEGPDRMDSIICREDYLAEDYARDNGITEAVVFELFS